MSFQKITTLLSFSFLLGTGLLMGSHSASWVSSHASSYLDECVDGNEISWISYEDDLQEKLYQENRSWVKPRQKSNRYDLDTWSYRNREIAWVTSDESFFGRNYWTHPKTKAVWRYCDDGFWEREYWISPECEQIRNSGLNLMELFVKDLRKRSCFFNDWD